MVVSLYARVEHRSGCNVGGCGKGWMVFGIGVIWTWVGGIEIVGTIDFSWELFGLLSEVEVGVWT